MNATTRSDPNKPKSNDADWCSIVRHKVESLRFGVVRIVVHEGTVTQIESTEKTRLDSRPSRS
jgi:hypothetical protein